MREERTGQRSMTASAGIQLDKSGTLILSGLRDGERQTQIASQIESLSSI